MGRVGEPELGELQRFIEANPEYWRVSCSASRPLMRDRERVMAKPLEGGRLEDRFAMVERDRTD